MADEDNAIAIFRQEAKYNGAKSKAEGRPIYDEHPFVEIIIPGNNKDVVDRPVTEEDKKRFPNQWAAFSNRTDGEITEGTPVKEAPWLGRAQVAMLEHLNVFTIENLAGLGDSEIQNLGPGGRDLVAKAANWIDLAKEGAMNNAAISDMKNLRAENEELRDKIGALEGRLANIEASDDTPARPKRTRRAVGESANGE